MFFYRYRYLYYQKWRSKLEEVEKLNKIILSDLLNYLEIVEKW